MRNFRFVVVTVALSGCFSDGVEVKQNPDDEAALSWGLVTPGTVYETRTVTQLTQSSAPDGVTFSRHRLLSATATDAELELEIASDGVMGEPARVRVPLRGELATPACPEISTQKSLETVTVPAGTFDCEKSTVTFSQDGVTRTTSTWTSRGVPVPIKWTLENESLTSTTELSRIVKP